MSYEFDAGDTAKSVDVFFADDSGFAVTGKVAADFPACKWSACDNTADTAITLSDLASITTAHPNNNTAGGIKEREGGWYRLDLPNNMIAAAGHRKLTFAETTGKRILCDTIVVRAPVTIKATVNDGAPTAGSFIGSSGLDGTHDDYYAGCTLVFTTGSLQGIARKVSSYTSSTKTFHFTGLTGDADQAFPIAPSNGDAFYLIGRIGH